MASAAKPRDHQVAWPVWGSPTQSTLMSICESDLAAPFGE
jgi:hypothetical protein